MAQQYAKDQPSGFSNRIKNIAIVGATGSVGEHLTEHLLKNGNHTITAITRADSKSKMPEGVKVAKVNYEDESTLVDALKGQDALVITMKAGQTDAQGKLIEAAAKANVKWVMPNEYSPDVVANPKMGEVSRAPLSLANTIVLTVRLGEWTRTTRLVRPRKSRATRGQLLGRSKLLVLVPIFISSLTLRLRLRHPQQESNFHRRRENENHHVHLAAMRACGR